MAVDGLTQAQWQERLGVEGSKSFDGERARDSKGERRLILALTPRSQISTLSKTLSMPRLPPPPPRERLSTFARRALVAEEAGSTRIIDSIYRQREGKLEAAHPLQASRSTLQTGMQLSLSRSSLASIGPTPMSDDTIESPGRARRHLGRSLGEAGPWSNSASISLPYSHVSWRWDGHRPHDGGSSRPGSRTSTPDDGMHRLRTADLRPYSAASTSSLADLVPQARNARFQTPRAEIRSRQVSRAASRPFGGGWKGWVLPAADGYYSGMKQQKMARQYARLGDGDRLGDAIRFGHVHEATPQGGNMALIR